MQLYIRNCLERQPANGYKNFLIKSRKNPGLSNAEVNKNQDKNHKQTHKQNWSGGHKTTYSSPGFPSGVASSVVQDNTPNNLRSGVTNILNNLQTIDF